MSVQISDLLFAGAIIAVAPNTLAQVNDPKLIQDMQQDLYLDVELNQSAQPEIGHFLQQDKQLYIDVTSLDKLSIQSSAPQILVDQTNYISLDAINGLSYQYDNLNQKITIQVPIELLSAKNQYSYQAKPLATVNPQQERQGLLLNYTAFAQQTDDHFSFNGWNELRYFGLFNGVLSISGNYQ